MNSSARQTPVPPGIDWDDDEEPWRHPPVAPRFAKVTDSLGKSVSDVVTGPLEGDAEKAERRPPPGSPSGGGSEPTRKP